MATNIQQITTLFYSNANIIVAPEPNFLDRYLCSEGNLLSKKYIQIPNQQPTKAKFNGLIWTFKISEARQ